MNKVITIKTLCINAHFNLNFEVHGPPRLLWDPGRRPGCNPLLRGLDLLACFVTQLGITDTQTSAMPPSLQIRGSAHRSICFFLYCVHRAGDSIWKHFHCWWATDHMFI